MLKIVKDPAPSLREKCKEVQLPLNEEHQKLIDDMLDYLLLTQDPTFRAKHPEAREGVGLAAPQVGKQLRMLVISYADYDENGEIAGKTEYQLVNPKITTTSVRKAYIDGGEGCLSVDEAHQGHVIRHFKIVVEAYEAKRKEKVTITARGYDAIVLQHEIDHLDGVLYYDRIDKLDPFKKIPGAYVC
jgi:peptide deformylase